MRRRRVDAGGRRGVGADLRGQEAESAAEGEAESREVPGEAAD